MKLILSILLFFSLAANASTFYVSSSTGLDSNTGADSTHPWQHISRVTNAFPNPGDIILLKGGDTFNETVYWARNGTPGNPITYSTYGTGKAIINGFSTLTGGTNLGNNIYEFFCAGLTVRTNMLVMDNVVQRMGTYPDVNSFSYTGLSSTTLTDGINLPSSPYNWTGATLGLYSEFYIIDTIHITAQTSTTLTLATPPSIINSRGLGYFIMNDPRILLLTSRIGSWYNKYSVDSMQVYLPGGLGSHVLKVPVRDTLGYASVIHDVTINNLDFEGSNEYTIYLNNTTNFTFTNCIFRYGGGNGFQGGQCPNTSFINDTLSYFNNNGGYITGSTSTHNVLLNSYISDIGLLAGMGQGGTNGSAGYTGWTSTMGFNTFGNNTFKRIGYSALVFSGDSCNAYNSFIDSFCLTKRDGGGIYTWDPSFQTYPHPRNVFNNTITHGGGFSPNIVYDSTDASFGVYTDGHSMSVNIFNNTVAFNTSGAWMDHGSSMNVHDNHFFGNLYTQILVSEAATIGISGLNVQNNVLGTNTTGQYLSVFATANSDLTSFGTVDINHFNPITGTTTPFFTKSSVDAGTPRTEASWQANVLYDLHSTYLAGVVGFQYNTDSINHIYYVQGLYQDYKGNNYYSNVKLPPLNSVIFLQISITLPQRFINIRGTQKPNIVQ